MPGEKRNSIKQKLAQMETIPEGFAFDKMRTWQKMEAAIDNSSKRKQFLLLPAAAILILLLANFFFVQPTQHQPEMENEIVSTSLPVEKEKPVQHHITKNRTVDTARPHNTTHKKSTFIVDKDISNETDTAFIFFQTKEASMADLSLIGSDTIMVTAAVQKPKFKIAHANELYTPQTVLPPSLKTGLAFSLSRSSLPGQAEEMVSPEEKIIVRKKQKMLLSSLLSSSQ